MRLNRKWMLSAIICSMPYASLAYAEEGISLLQQQKESIASETIEIAHNEVVEDATKNPVSKREPASPKGSYKFSLADIQSASRAGVENAWKQIKKIEQDGFLRQIAQTYFEEYLDHIGSYNQVKPQVDDIETAFRTELILAHVLKAFKQQFPDLIYEDSNWFLNTVGGIYANTIILYCSTGEYIVIWGTSLPSHGNFSGYYPFMNEFDVMISGKMLSHNVINHGHVSVNYEPHIDAKGIRNQHTVDTSNLSPSNVRVYTLEPYSYMVSYAQGSMAKAFLPGAIMPGLFVTQDIAGLKSHIVQCAKSYFNSNPDWIKPLKSGKEKVSKFFKKLCTNPFHTQTNNTTAVTEEHCMVEATHDNYLPLYVVDEFYANLEK